MHPNTFLKSLWRSDTLNQVFVAMTFDPRLHKRFDTVFKPAIEDVPIGGYKLSAYRVDNSKTGDSILTEIMDGIAHSRIVLADVSVVDEGRYTDQPIRNGNVMYEVGLALASRNPSEVLLVRDDNKKFLFDVSSIPHLTIDFSDIGRAIVTLRSALGDRVRETDSLKDARIALAVRSLTEDELRILGNLADLQQDEARDLSNPRLGSLSIPNARGVDGLLQKGCIRSVAVHAKRGSLFYSMTPFGYVLAKAAREFLETLDEPDMPKQDLDPGAAL